MCWKWVGFKSGFRVRFEKPKSNIKCIMSACVTLEETQRRKVRKVEGERAYIEKLYKEELLRGADRNMDLTYTSYKDEFNRMQGCTTNGLLYCMKKNDSKFKHQADELGRQNEILYADVAYIHKAKVSYGLKSAKQQQAYKEAKAKMEEPVDRIARLCAVTAMHY